VAGSSRIVAEAYDPEAETIYVRFPDGVEWFYAACPPMFGSSSPRRSNLAASSSLEFSITSPTTAGPVEARQRLRRSTRPNGWEIVAAPGDLQASPRSRRAA